MGKTSCIRNGLNRKKRKSLGNLKLAEYKRSFEPKVLNSKMLKIMDPSLNNGRFSNTPNTFKKEGFGGGFRLKPKEEVFQ